MPGSDAVEGLGYVILVTIDDYGMQGSRELPHSLHILT